MCQFLELLQGNTCIIKGSIGLLEPEIADDGYQIGITASFTDTIDGPLNMPGTGIYCRKGARNGIFGIVVRVNSQPVTRNSIFDYGLGCRTNILGKSTTVGITQYNPSCSGQIGFLGTIQGIFFIGKITIEEMLGIKNDFLALGNQMLY